MKEKETNYGATGFMPDAHDQADAAKIIPPAVETPIKQSAVVYPQCKERLKAAKPWKPKGRK